MKKLTLTLGSLVAVAAPVAAVVACGSDDDSKAGVSSTETTRAWNTEEKAWINKNVTIASDKASLGIDAEHIILTINMPKFASEDDFENFKAEALKAIDAHPHAAFVSILRSGGDIFGLGTPEVVKKSLAPSA